MSTPRIAVVGAGYMGRLHAEKLSALAAEGELRFAAVCDVDAGRAGELAAKYGVPALADPHALAGSADAAVVAVPTVDHARVAGALLEAGLDVLVEKPIAATREQAQGLVAGVAQFEGDFNGLAEPHIAQVDLLLIYFQPGRAGHFRFRRGRGLFAPECEGSQACR